MNSIDGISPRLRNESPIVQTKKQPSKAKKTPQPQKTPPSDEISNTLPKNELTIQEKANSPELQPEKSVSSAKKSPRNPKKSKKIFLILPIFLLIGSSLGILFYFYHYLPSQPVSKLEVLKTENQTNPEKYYSPLTGLEISDPNLASAPVYCVQTPNGLDGARPQVGLKNAGVVFEAIAEAGITRFAAIYQNPTTPVIGPIRSLRTYYLEWDTPFDCTIVHAGGSPSALEALKTGNYRDLTENYSYMWRGDSNRVVKRLWNNLFTSSENISKFNENMGYNSSNVQGFTRETPENAEKSRFDALVSEKLDIDTATEKSVKTLQPQISHLIFKFGNVSSFNPVYDYNQETNTYNRSYASGNQHVVYDCPSDITGKVTPELVCSDTIQLSPSVVIAMIVEEKLDTDNYHELITTIGSGKAYVFQNGQVIEGTWTKPSKASQIVFKDNSGTEIKLNPGQTWISAIPTYGSVEYN